MKRCQGRTGVDEVVWSDAATLASSFGSIRVATETTKPITTESTNETVKTFAAGMPADPDETLANARAYYHYTRGCGCTGHPAFPAPLWGSARSLLGVAPRPFLGVRIHAQLGRIAPREAWWSESDVIPNYLSSSLRTQGPITPGVDCCTRSRLIAETRVRAVWVPASAGTTKSLANLAAVQTEPTR